MNYLPDWLHLVLSVLLWVVIGAWYVGEVVEVRRRLRAGGSS